MKTIYIIIKCTFIALVNSFKLAYDYRKALKLTEEIIEKEQSEADNRSCGDDPYVCGYIEGLKLGAKKYR